MKTPIYSVCSRALRPLTAALLITRLLPLVVPSHTLSQEPTPQPLRAGMIGLDTSHVPAFAKLFNDPKATSELAGIHVVAGYPGGTDMPASRDRVGKFTEQLRGMGIEIVPTIPALLEKVDVVLLESVDGRIHLQEAILSSRPANRCSLTSRQRVRSPMPSPSLAQRHNVPCFSSSSLRFGSGVQELKTNAALGEIVGAITWVQPT